MRHLYQTGKILLLLLIIAVPVSVLRADTVTQPTGAQPAGEARLVLGILPLLSPERLALRFQPLADYLSSALGVPVVMQTAPNYREFARRTQEEHRYDLLFTAPHFYYIAQRDSGYRVVARVAGPPLSAVIVAPMTTRILTLKDLRGHRVATPDSLSLGTLLIRHRLAAAGLDPETDVKLMETPSHNASLMSTIKGFSDAAGLMVPPFQRAASEIREQLQIIAETASTPHMPFSVAPWISEDQAEAFAKAMVAASAAPEGRALLEHLAWPGFVRAQPADYDVLEPFAKLITIE